MSGHAEGGWSGSGAAGARPVTFAELMAAMSLATDIGMGLPLETGLRVCHVVARSADRLQLAPGLRERVYSLALLGHIGCTANNHEAARLLGDELLMRAHLGTVDLSRPSEAFPFMASHIGRAFAPGARPAALLRAMAAGRQFKAGAVAVCEVARMLGERLGLDEAFRDDLASMYEQWDGKGFPGRLRGEAVTVPARVVQVAALAVEASRLAGGGRDGVAAAAELLRARAGRTLDPQLAGAFATDAGELLEAPPVESLWEAVMAAEPAPRRLTDAGVDASLRVMGDFADLKSPFLVGHSAGVAELAAAAAERFGLPQADVVAVRRAGWVHDVGRVGVSSGIWGKRGLLTSDERERVRLHAYLTDRVLARPAFLRDLGAVASMHHERLDGSGYFRGSGGAQQSPAARILAAADAYRAMTEPRPHRPALEPSAAARELRSEARAGRMDAGAVEAVVEAAGQPARRRRGAAAGLTAREVEVLRLLAQGLSTKEIARALVVAPKTADAHIQHIYAKANVTTRAAATLFAIRALVAAGDRATVDVRWTATHSGTLATPQGEVPATGRQVTLDHAIALRAEDDLVASVHVYLDQLDFMAQLGLVPQPTTA